MSVIKLLPDSVANQIAAGEVVQRPSSVVKELLENSVDSGAKTIRLIIKDAGKTLIHVLDDGIGMNKDDLKKCFFRHTTSKIRNSKDLYSLKTMGFRGEALSSIASVSHMSIISNQENTKSLGYEIKLEGGEEKLFEYLGKSISYPQMAKEAGVKGKVYVQFVVEKNGAITDIKIIRGIGSGCDEEAKKAVKNMPKWEPGEQRGKPVRVRFVLPVNFSLR